MESQLKNKYIIEYFNLDKYIKVDQEKRNVTRGDFKFLPFPYKEKSMQNLRDLFQYHEQKSKFFSMG